ncbi:hypothetical protein RND81_01G178000 [Saponaria officinalis]|uniref:DUF4408 domain-containing protein n=1 Tax=Saponaria officinalis TaxID=3572 RepID=A0AAW1NHZ6_SAPOF
METIYEIDSIKIEKQKAMRRYRTFRKIPNIVRILEIFVAILFVSISFSWTSWYIPAMLNYSAVFLRRLSSVLFSPHFVFVIGNVIIITLFVNSGDHSPENVDVSFGEIVVTPSTELVVVEKEEEEEEVVEKVYRRSKSTSMVKAEVVERRELRRSSTVPRRRVEERRRCEEDELSNEEFNRKVEEFIEKQRRFLSEETKVLVLTN